MINKALTAREVYQILRDIALGIRAMRRIGKQSWGEIYTGNMTVEVDSWVLNLYNDCNMLGYCESCFAPDGRTGSFADWQRHGTDPVDLLSTWEREQVEKLLTSL